jgi:TfoX/Sxy family transcriptional regulator of competence genes
MAYDEDLADRIREVLADRKGLTEKKMFGGLSFMLAGNMCCGIVKDNLVVRVDPDSYEKALAKPHARPMDFTGRPIKGMVYVGPEGYSTDEELKYWLDQALGFALSLPPKTSQATRKVRRRP